MPTSGWLGSLLWFAAIVAVIPLALWLLKRTPMGGAASSGLMRHVAVLPLSASQRVVTVEVGQGEARRWLVLGVTPGSITTLHTMDAQADAPASTSPALPGFAQMLGRLRQDKGVAGDH
ncbi:MAG: flagellar biosynthetic protein FliO [Burkholderiales bacterium]